MTLFKYIIITHALLAFAAPFGANAQSEQWPTSVSTNQPPFATSTTSTGQKTELRTKKEQFFNQALNDGNWWAKWSSLEYADGWTRNYSDIKDSSELIKDILENEYNVKVPFDPSQVEKLQFAKIINRYISTQRTEDGDWCRALTPWLLASVVSASNSLIAPEFISPAQPELARENAKNYLRISLKILGAYCDTGRSGQFYGSLIKFLDEYAQILKQAKQLRIDRETAKRTEIALAEEAAKKKTEALKRKQELLAERAEAAEKKKREIAEQESAKTRMAMRIEQQKIADARNEQLRLEKERYKSDLTSGKRPVLTISDAISFHNANGGLDVVTHPPVFPDKKAYYMRGVLKRKSGNEFIFEIGSGVNVKYFKAIILSSTRFEDKYRLEFESNGYVVGRFIGTFEYNTIGGELRNAPIFEALFVGS